MKRVTRNSVIAFAAASGAMAMAGAAHADSAAGGYAGGSPGLVSGNGIQLPVDVPVNACGNTVNVVGLLNPAMGNRCANQGDHATGKAKEGARTSGGATAVGKEQGSPGVISGNGVQLPVDLPVNVSGNTVDVVGIGNPVFGNQSVNTSGPRPEAPGRSTPRPPARHTPPVRHQPHEPSHRPAPHPSSSVVRQRTPGTLAHTGADGTWTAAVAGLASLMGGTVLYRRFRPGATGSES
ncbi:chaplin family protein [Streptomyces sp. SCL15-4]|uniref:chaplin family protein n=1 Tax=Streptomyces sp. SCL15-4 TaxID=2967221 RepID=UPI00296601BD|nr:chaplin family protein [Streptomyces sp. SCL15-4]